jgi:hypothetical protein
MSCHICDMTSVARGPSGRFVIDLEPEIKENMHTALAQDHTTLKDWFRARVESYLAERTQPNLPGIIPSSPAVKRTATGKSAMRA